MLQRWLEEHDGNPNNTFPGLGTTKPEQFRQPIAENCVTCSIGCSGNIWDNTAMESFFSALKTEQVARKVYRSRFQARPDILDFNERFQNAKKRRHLTIGYLNSTEFERGLDVY